MYGAATTSKKMRISKKLLSKLPPKVAREVKKQAEQFSIKSVTLHTLTEGYKVIAGEGERYTMIRGKKSWSIEMVASHTMGAANLCHDIGGEVVPPVGTWVIRIFYYNKFWMDVGNIVPRQIGE